MSRRQGNSRRTVGARSGVVTADDQHGAGGVAHAHVLRYTVINRVGEGQRADAVDVLAIDTERNLAGGKERAWPYGRTMGSQPISRSRTFISMWPGLSPKVEQNGGPWIAWRSIRQT